MKSEDNGKNWQSVVEDINLNTLPYYVPVGTNCPDTTHCYSVGGNRIAFSSNNGKSWQLQYTETQAKNAFIDISCGSITTCVIGGHGGIVETTTDGGQHWTHQPISGITEDIDRISCPSAITCYAYAHTDIHRLGN
jgi:photosystem II stability/assembly factor-like uncharacterized protein